MVDETVFWKIGCLSTVFFRVQMISIILQDSDADFYPVFFLVQREGVTLVSVRFQASLIDQDLALMKQLLTLNEQIEELKWQRKLRGYQAGSGSVTSSCNIDSNVSVATLSDGEWDSRLDHRECPGKYPTPSSLSLYSDYGTSPRASVDKELSRSNAAGPGPSKLVQDNTHKLLGGESTSDLGSSDELTSSNSELPEYNTARTTNTRIVQQSIRPEKHVQDQQKKQHTSRFLKVKTLELAL